ncbi:MAG: alpha/beta fold hydrolase [Acidimicrobiales bacterium]|nr:alpha/beta fold hydrolase [Acidimicrobiales bacterium]
MPTLTPIENVRLETISLHGHEVAYWRGGSGPALVLLHGMAGEATTWQPILERLARDYTVIAPDLPGHGRSAKPRGDYSLGAYASFVRDLLVQLDTPQATIVGQSLGGGIAMQFGYQHPEYCQRLVLVASGGLGEEVAWVLRALAAPGMEFVMPIAFLPWVKDRLTDVAGVLSRVGLQASPQTAEMWRAYQSLTDRESRTAFVHTIRSVIDLRGQRVNAENRLYLAADVPTLIVWGAKDPIIPLDHGQRAHDIIPGSRFEIFETAGHFPHAEEPDRFATLLDEFITTTEGHDATSS